MSDSLTVDLKDLRASDGPSVGGKNANLGELLSANIPVPDGFAITTLAYQQLILNTDIKTEIVDLLTELDIDDFDSLTSTSQKIRTLIENIALPENLKSEILSSYNSLGSDVEVAVRSSCLLYTSDAADE